MTSYPSSGTLYADLLQPFGVVIVKRFPPPPPLFYSQSKTTMSYTLLSMIGVKRGIHQHWQQVLNSDYNIQGLFSTFRRVIMTLSDGSGTVYADLHQLQAQYAQWPDSLQALLGSLVSLVSTSVPPQINIQTAKWSLSSRSGYHAVPWDPVRHDAIPAADRSGVLLQRESPQTDYTALYKSCLVSINGFYHLTDVSGTDGLLVYDAAKTIRKSNSARIGIYSFFPLGGVTLIPITPAMVFKRQTPEMIAGTIPTPGYKDIGYVKLPVSVAGKTTLLVLGGYLHTPDQNIHRMVSDTELEISTNQIPLADRYFESSRVMDLSSLGLPLANLGVVDQAQLTSDAVWLKYLTLSQSFVVVINQPSIFVNRFPVQKVKVLGEYMTYQRPTYPLQVGLGRHCEYWWDRDDRRDQWSLQCTDAATRRMTYNTTDPFGLTRITDMAYPADPEQNSQASFVEIGCDTTVI